MDGLFFIAVLLPPELEKKIIQFKQDFAENFNAPYALKPPGHITLTETFRAKNEQMQKLLPVLNKLFGIFQPFTAAVRNFGAFPASLAIFAAIQNHEPFNRMREELFWLRKNKGILDDKSVPSKSITPNITIGYRDLEEEIFHAAWKKYAQLEFSADFLVDKIHLMQHKKKWRSACEFPLLGLPDGRSEQLKLF